MSGAERDRDADALWGLVAEFKSADALLAAAREVHRRGYTRIEAYSPFPVDGLAEAIGFRRNRIAPITFIGGLIGGVSGYFLQWYSAVIDYPLNIGGRPLHSWPMFIPVTFELTVLGAALAAFFGVIISNRLPDVSYPLFKAPDFDLAMRNRFFLCLRSDDPHFERERAAALLDSFDPIRCSEVRR